jgi:predicted dinucleotide-binding enzyme
MFSSRHPEQLNGPVNGLVPRAQAGSVKQAIAFGDIVPIVVPYTAIEQIGKDHATALAKKTLVINVSKPIAARRRRPR